MLGDTINVSLASCSLIGCAPGPAMPLRKRVTYRDTASRQPETEYHSSELLWSGLLTSQLQTCFCRMRLVKSLSSKDNEPTAFQDRRVRGAQVTDCYLARNGDIKRWNEPFCLIHIPQILPNMLLLILLPLLLASALDAKPVYIRQTLASNSPVTPNYNLTWIGEPSLPKVL